MTAFEKFLAGFTMMIFGTILNGIYFKHFWEWFVVQPFPQLPSLSIIQSIGFAFFLSVYTEGTSKSKDEITKELLLSMFKAFFTGSAVFGVGYLIHLMYQQ